MLEIFDCEQGTPEWLEIRAGIITASEMSSVLAKGQGKTRDAYMRKLIGEVITGEPAETYTNKHMERGHEWEPMARELYAERTGNTGHTCGFMRRNRVGYSPDWLVSDNGLTEIKTRLPHLQVELLLAQKVPSEHKAQIQCGLWVSEREWLDFVSYSKGMPLFVQRVYRDEEYIKTMEAEVARFYEELDEKLNIILEAA